MHRGSDVTVDSTAARVQGATLMATANRRGIATASVLLALLLAGAVVLLPRVGNAFAGADGIHDAGALPEHIKVCGRSWHKDALSRTFRLAEIRVRDGVEPVVVDPGPFAACPPGPCTTVAQPGPCDTVIYVRVGDDAYVDYALQGGP